MLDGIPKNLGLQRPELSRGPDGTVMRRHRSWLEVREQARALRALAVGPVIYAVQADDGTIKIGHSISFPSRFRQYQHYRDVIILAFAPGSLADERAIHEKLQAHRKRGREWYHPTSEVLAVVNDLREHFDLPPVMFEEDSELVGAILENL